MSRARKIIIAILGIIGMLAILLGGFYLIIYVQASTPHSTKELIGSVSAIVIGSILFLLSVRQRLYIIIPFLMVAALFRDDTLGWTIMVLVPFVFYVLIRIYYAQKRAGAADVNKKNLPTSIAIMADLGIILSLISSTPFVLYLILVFWGSTSSSFGYFVIMDFFLVAYGLLSSIGLLKRKNWARFTFIGLVPLFALMMSTRIETTTIGGIYDSANSTADFRIVPVFGGGWASLIYYGVAMLLTIWIFRKLTSKVIRNEFTR